MPFLCICICVCACMRVYMGVYVYVYSYIHTFSCTHKYTHMHIHIYVQCMHIHMYTHMRVCVHTHRVTQTYTRIRTLCTFAHTHTQIGPKPYNSTNFCTVTMAIQSRNFMLDFILSLLKRKIVTEFQLESTQLYVLFDPCPLPAGRDAVRPVGKGKPAVRSRGADGSVGALPSGPRREKTD